VGLVHNLSDRHPIVLLCSWFMRQSCLPYAIMT